MKKKIVHRRLMECEILIEVQTHKGQYLVLVKTLNKPVMHVYSSLSYSTSPKEYTHKKVIGKKNKVQYYILWGNESDYDKMGITHIVTDKANPVFEETAVRIFIEMSEYSKSVLFKSKHN